MIKVIIDPDFINDPKLIEQKSKLDIAFADWQCSPGKEGMIILSHDPEKREFNPCKENSAEDFMKVYNMALHPHSDI